MFGNLFNQKKVNKTNRAPYFGTRFDMGCLEGIEPS